MGHLVGALRLDKGRHLPPRDGVCLVEAAAALAGEAHSDHPRSVHPLLAAVARVVNDVVSDGARQQLVSLAPRLVGTASADPAVARRVLEAVVAPALPVALPVWAPVLRRTLSAARAGRRFPPLGPERWVLRIQERVVGYALASVALVTRDGRDDALSALLERAVDAAQRRGGASTPHIARVPSQHSNPDMGGAVSRLEEQVP